MSSTVPHRELYAESIDGCRNGLLSGVAMDSWVTQPWPVGARTPPSLANGPCRNFSSYNDLDFLMLITGFYSCVPYGQHSVSRLQWGARSIRTGPCPPDLPRVGKATNF